MAAEDRNEFNPSFPRFYMEIDGIKNAVVKVPGLTNYIPVKDWGFGISHQSGADSVGSYQLYQPPSATLLYVRMHWGGYLPSLVSNLFNKIVSPKAMLVSVGNMKTDDQVLGGLQFENVSIEKILFGNTSGFNLGSPLEGSENLEDATFEMHLRFLKFRVQDTDFDQTTGAKKGQTASSFDFTTGKVGR